MKTVLRDRLFLVGLGVLIGLGVVTLKRSMIFNAGDSDPAALMVKVREVAWLTSLEVSLYKKVSFEPAPIPSKSAWGSMLNWARFSVNPPHGRAIVFANVQLFYDLEKMPLSDLRIAGDRVELRLPPLKAKVALRPEETEFINSTLDSEQTAQLFSLAKEGFEQEVLADQGLRKRAELSSQNAVKAFLLTLGYHSVHIEVSDGLFLR